MVVLSALANVPLSDVLYTSSKKRDHPCHDMLSQQEVDSGKCAHFVQHRLLEDEPASARAVLMPTDDSAKLWPDTVLLTRANEQLDRFMKAPGTMLVLFTGTSRIILHVVHQHARVSSVGTLSPLSLYMTSQRCRHAHEVKRV
jgi:hypothetical protein